MTRKFLREKQLINDVAMPNDGQTPKRKVSPVKLEDIYNQNVDTQKNVKEIKSSIDEVKACINQIDRRVHSLEESDKKINVKLSVNDCRLNDLEQYNKRKCMEIKGIDSNELNEVSDMKSYSTLR